MNDTLDSIAQSLGIKTEDLRKINGFDDDYIYPGEIIVVPNDNVRFYITSEGENLNKVLNILGVSNPLENQNIYLLPNQLIVHKN